MKRHSQTLKIVIVLSIAVMAFGGLTSVARANFSEPGSQEDPVITLSYVEKRLEQMKYYIDQKIEEINSLGNENSTAVENTSGGASFQVVFIEKGKNLYLGEGTELILRSGQATAIASSNGGLSDVTIGKDLKSGESIPSNHLIIIPRNDGRGASILVDSYFMIKGAYTIQ